jgi:GNAT superfamily N-acetyltransferase
MVTLRAVGVEDADLVATLVRAAFAAQSVPTDPPASALRLSADDVRAHLAGGGGGAVVAEADRLVGSALWSEQDGGLYVARVAVDAAWRRRGVARRLLGAAEAAARVLGLPRLHLGTRLVLLDNRTLFAACGFVEVSRHAHPGYDAPTWVAMEKRL